MLSDPRPIYFETELKFLTFDETQFGKSHVRKLYHALCGGADPLYENLDMQAALPTMSTNRTGGKVSCCSVGPDTLTIKEDNPEFTVHEFGLRIEEVLRGINEISDRESPPIVGQRTKVRALSQPHGHEDSVDLLAGEVAKVMENIQPFGRPPAWFGLRFRFPPLQWESEDADGVTNPHEENSFVTLRFETYAQDISQVWMEATAVELFREALDVGDFEKVTQNVRNAYDFLSRGRDFLNQYDDGENTDSDNGPDSEVGD